MANKSSENFRIASRKYSDVADDVREARGWKKSEVAKMAQEQFPEFNITQEQVYEWFEGNGDPRTSFSKVMETILGISLPAQCYWNAGKR